MPIETLPLKGDQRGGDAKFVSAPDGSATHRGMAHFAGTGPPGRHCYNCQHFRLRVKKSGKGFCAKYVELMGASLATAQNTKPPQFVSGALACKYFQEIVAK